MKYLCKALSLKKNTAVIYHKRKQMLKNITIKENKRKKKNKKERNEYYLTS